MHACLRTLKSAGISGKATEQSLRGGSELAELLPDDDKDLFVNGESAERGMYKRPCSRARKRDTLSGNGAETLQHAYIHTYIHTFTFTFHVAEVQLRLTTLKGRSFDPAGCCACCTPL